MITMETNTNCLTRINSAPTFILLEECSSNFPYYLLAIFLIFPLDPSSEAGNSGVISVASPRAVEKW